MRTGMSASLCVLFGLLSAVRDRQFDNCMGFKHQVGALVKEVEPGRDPDAWNKFGPTCSLCQTRMRIDVAPSPWVFCFVWFSEGQLFDNFVDMV
jgi:hypothetical protein